MDKCIIVASGPSAKGFIPPPGAPIIVVNGVIDWISRADYWFTLDPSPVNLERMNNPTSGVEYYAAVPQGTKLPSHVNLLKRKAKQGIEPWPKNTPKWWLWRWSAVAEMSDDKDSINTGNSAWGALQLAKHKGAKKVLLIGVDGTQEKRIGGGTPNNLSHLPLLFNSTTDDLHVVNCGKIECKFQKMSVEDGVKWLTS